VEISSRNWTSAQIIPQFILIEKHRSRQLQRDLLRITRVPLSFASFGHTGRARASNWSKPVLAAIVVAVVVLTATE
jgi:hypothetical protein